jgi:hypothetical protein
VRKVSLLSTAAIMLLGAGVASAQQVKDEGAGRIPAAQQNAPAEKSAPSMRAGERKGSDTTGQSSHETSPGASKGHESQDLKPGSDKGSGSKSSETTGQAPAAADQDKHGSGTKSSSDTNKGRANAPMKDQTDTSKGASSDTKTQNNAQGAPATRSNESATDRTSTERSTTGQGAAGSVKLSTEQRTKITSVIRQQKVEPTHLNVSVNVGTRVPDSVRFHPLPVEVVDVYPEWRGYNYILVGQQIVVVDPRTHEIVAILDA